MSTPTPFSPPSNNIPLMTLVPTISIFLLLTLLLCVHSQGSLVGSEHEANNIRVCKKLYRQFGGRKKLILIER